MPGPVHAETLVHLRCAAVNKYLPRPKVAQGVNLLSGKNDAGEQRTQAEQAAAAAAPREIINFLKPNISIAIVDDRSEYAVGQLVPQASRAGPWPYKVHILLVCLQVLLPNVLETARAMNYCCLMCYRFERSAFRDHTLDMCCQAAALLLLAERACIM